MLRKLLILGVCAGSSASVPILYQANPETFHRLIGRAVGPSAEQPVVETAVVDVVKPKAPEPLGRKVRLTADARGHFTADFKFNGRRIDAIIDTGATLVALNASTARRIGITVAPSDFKYTVETANGKTQAAGIMIDSLQVGRIVVENVPGLVLEDKALKETLIGVSFLSKLGKYQVEDGVLVMVQ